MEMMLNATNTNFTNGEEMMTLEAEISELQRENARVESQMLKLKSDITAMETQLDHSDQSAERVRSSMYRLVHAEN